MKKTLLAMLGLLSMGPSMALAQGYVGSVDVSTQISASTGIHTAHIAAVTSGTTTVLYLNGLNNGASGQTVNVLQIIDPLGTPSISTIGSIPNVSATRGSGGIAVASNGDVFYASTGNGGDDSAFLRRVTNNGTLLNEWVFTAATGGLNERFGGMDVNAAGTHVVGTRFLSTTNQKLAFYTLTAPPLTRLTPVMANPGSGQNPRDVAYDATTGKMYLNSNGILEVLGPTAGGDITNQNSYAAASGGTGSVLVAGEANSFAGHGVAVNADGSLIAYTPSQNAGIGSRTIRVVNPDGELVMTFGQLNTPGDGTSGLLQRPTDAAFFTQDGVEYLAVTDYQLNTFSRIAIYNLTPSTVLVANDGTGDFLSIQDAITGFTPAGVNGSAVPPLTINIKPTGTPYNERISLNDGFPGLGNIVGDITLQSSVPGTLVPIALQRTAGEAASVNSSGLFIYQNEHDVTLRDLLLYPSTTGEQFQRHIVKIDENSANSVFNTITLENVIVTEVATNGLPLITERAQAFDAPTSATGSARTGSFANTVQYWGDTGESLHVVLDGVTLYGAPSNGGISANHLRAVFAGQDGESLTIRDTVMAYGPAGHGIRMGSTAMRKGDLTIDGLTIYNSPSTGANHMIIFESTAGPSGPSTASINDITLVRDINLNTATRGISGGATVEITDLSNAIIVSSGAGIVDVVTTTTLTAPAQWSNLTIHNNSTTTGDNAVFLAGGAGSLEITDAIFSGPGTKISASPVPTNGIFVDYSSFVEVGPDSITARNGAIAISYGANIISGDPHYVTKDFGASGFFDVQNELYAAAGSAASDLGGGANYVGGVPVTSVRDWMMLAD